MRTTALLAILICIVNTGLCQLTFNGVVKDAKTKEPLAFASIEIIKNKQGTTTDIDGKFSLKWTEEKVEVKITYLGYASKIVVLQNFKNMIELTANQKALEDIILDNKINPAHRIIDSFLIHKNQNNPYNYKTFQYNAYTKAGIAGENYFWNQMEKEDTVQIVKTTNTKAPKKMKTVVVDSATFAKMKEKGRKTDSIRAIENIRDSLLEAGIRNNYIVFTESYTKRYFKSPNRSKEIVEATKFSGIDNPNFSFTSNNFQPFGMYNNFIEMIGKAYQSPVSNGCKNDYRFVLKDIIINNNDTTFIISYRPKKGKNFTGLQGFVHINSNGWALENIIAKPYKDSGSLMSFKLQQQYGLVKNKWFPKQLNTIINRKDSKNDSSVLYWDSKSYFTNIEINEPIPNNVFDEIVLDYNENAGQVKDSLWNNYRNDTLSKKDKGTYETYKLMPDEVKKVFNTMPKVLEIIALQAIPWGKFDLPVKDFIGINKYEDLRLGIGVRTNNKFSNKFTLAANTGYGFGDKSLKYAMSSTYHISKKYNTNITFMFRQDVEEPGNVAYFKSNNLLLGSKTFRNFLIERMDSIKEFKIAFTTKPLPALQLDGWFSNQQRNEGNSNYMFKQDNANNASEFFTNTEVGLGIKYTVGETFTKLGRAKVLQKPATTQLMFSLTKGLPDVLNGNLDYNKVAFLFNHSYRTRKFGETKFQLYGGQVFGNVPYSYLFNTSAANTTNKKSAIIYVPNHFQTVGLYEFVSDRMIHFSLEQNFGTLFFNTKSIHFKPEFSIIHNMSYGWLQNRSIHQNLNIKTLEDGLFESGLLIKNIYRQLKADMYYLGYGIGCFYRYGANSNERFIDNFNVKLSLSVGF